MMRAFLLFGFTLPLAAGGAWLISVVTLPLFVPILVPVAMGTVAGVALGFGAHLLGVRSRSAVVAVGLTAWLLVSAVQLWVEYRRGFVEAVRMENALEASAAGDPGYSDADALRLSDELLVDVVGVPGFRGFLKLRALGGMRLRGLPTARADGRWAMVLWAADLLACLLILLRIGWGAQTRLRLSGEAGSRYNAGPPKTGGKGGG